MRYIYLLSLLLMCGNAMGSSFQELPLIESHYELHSSEVLPSCKMFEYRKKEREKVLREMKHNLQKENVEAALLLKDQYITNKFFLDEYLWRDEVVIVVNMWSISEELSQSILAGNPLIFRLSGDGIEWQEDVQHFPDEVSFGWQDGQRLIITRHETYYVDFCGPRKPSQLAWTSESLPKSFLSEMKWQQTLKLIKEL